MSVGWSVLPLLPLRCILEHLSIEDAMRATSVCRHWRAAMLLYEGRKETLKLRAKQLDKSRFLARLFRKHVKRLHIYVDCNEEELEKFMTCVLPQFFDTLKLQEVLFVRPSSIQQNQHVPCVKLKRMITQSLVFKHLHSLQKLALLGCEMDTAKPYTDTYKQKHIEYYCRGPSLDDEVSPADSVLSSCYTSNMMFSTLQHIMVDYEQINTEALETLSNLSLFNHLTLNICNKRQVALVPIDWSRLQASYPNGLDVSVNLIALSLKMFDEVIENVLVEGLSLTSLKVMFCKTIYNELLGHVARVHKSTLQELVWADCPDTSFDYYPKGAKHEREIQYGFGDGCDVNPFIYMCWQCMRLRRLVIHGYWIWQYDILGFVRLRDLDHLEVSSICKAARSERSSPILRVKATDTPRHIDAEFKHKVNGYTLFNWVPIVWSKLHPGLRARATAQQRADYLAEEATRPLGVRSSV